MGNRRTVDNEEFLPIKANHRQDGTKLYNKGEGMHESIALGDSQQILRDNHVSRRRYWQELRQSLHDGNNYCFKPCHASTSFSF